MDLKDVIGSYKAMRAKNTLGITTLEQAAKLSNEELLKVPYIGKIAIQRIRNIYTRSITKDNNDLIQNLDNAIYYLNKVKETIKNGM